MYLASYLMYLDLQCILFCECLALWPKGALVSSFVTTGHQGALKPDSLLDSRNKHFFDMAGLAPERPFSLEDTLKTSEVKM